MLLATLRFQIKYTLIKLSLYIDHSLITVCENRLAETPSPRNGNEQSQSVAANTGRLTWMEWVQTKGNHMSKVRHVSFFASDPFRNIFGVLFNKGEWYFEIVGISQKGGEFSPELHWQL